MFTRGENPHHPPKGASIKVDPIRDIRQIQAIKRSLIDADKTRDYCLFTLGINTAWRANELLSVKVGDVRAMQEGGLLDLKQSKNNKYRTTPLNRIVSRALKVWLAVYDPIHDGAPLFPSRRGGAISVSTLNGMVKRWCADAGAIGHFGSHTLRKSWGYHQRVTFQASLPLLVKAFGHSSARQTLDYLGIQPVEVADLFRNEI